MFVMHEHWYYNPQNIFSGLLVLFTFVLGIANILLWKANRPMIKNQDKLLKLNIIMNVSDKLFQETQSSYKFFIGFFKAISRAIPEYEDKIMNWFEGDEIFDFKNKKAKQQKKHKNAK